MPIEVEVSLSRKAAVFLTGESFTVQVTLANRNGDCERSLAWGCVQLHCEENAVGGGGMARHQKVRHNASTAVTRAKQAIFSSAPAILFCDIRIGPGAVHQFETRKEIPADLPPTFKGHFAKYHWYVSVATQQVDAPIKLVQLPIKVFNVGIDVSVAKPLTERTIAGNPFLSRDIESPSVVELAVNQVEEICSVRKQRFYEIKSGGRLIATVVIFRNVFKLGDDVLGRLEFAQNELHCLQALVRAEVVETNLLVDDTTDSSNSRAADGATSAIHAHAFGTEHMVTAMVRETHFKLQLPMNAVPSFTTERVKVRWRLRFEFVTTAQKVLTDHCDEGVGSVRTLADHLDIETVKWDLPISVLSCNPFNAGLVTAQPSTTAFTIN